MTLRKKQQRMCKNNRCWICEKAGVRVSEDLHDLIMKGTKLRSSYFLAFTSLARFLIGEEADRIYNQCGQPDYNGKPSDAVREILSHFNLAKALRAHEP